MTLCICHKYLVARGGKRFGSNPVENKAMGGHTLVVIG